VSRVKTTPWSATGLYLSIARGYFISLKVFKLFVVVAPG
jgi:hypothetical protein